MVDWILLTLVLAAQAWIIYRMEIHFMAQFDDIEALVTEINTTTNDEAAALQAVSDRIDKLIAKLPANGMDATQVAQLKDQLTQFPPRKRRLKIASLLWVKILIILSPPRKCCT